MVALNTIFVQFVSSDSRRQKYERDLLREVHEKDLGRVRIAIAPSVDDELRTWCDHVISYGADSSIPDDYRVAIYVLFGQLLGLFASLHAGLKPDAPSPDGTITRVVSHVRIYP